MEQRKYPVGIQTFERMIKDGYVYIDKTDLVWKLTKVSPFVFLSRPRRFGKSLLSSTLESYFKGHKQLFEGLKIMSLEEDWRQFPVIHLDLSLLKGKSSAAELQRSLQLHLTNISLYPIDSRAKTPGEMLESMIRNAYQLKGEKVVVIVDEYDSPLLETLHENEDLPLFRKVMQELYQPLKALESMIEFCFITGITKFSQLSIFSTLNNLTNVTLQPEFSTICGITENELTTDMATDIAMLAEEYECTNEEMQEKLRMRYDGYHFSRNSVGVYNPFSLMKAFLQKSLDNYWFDSGTPTFLIQQMQHFHTDITALDCLELPSSAFDKPTEAMTTALPLLYQSGYLTIKDYDRELQLYTLSIPNREVRIGYTEGLLPVYLGLESYKVQMGFAAKFWQALRKQDVNQALQEMQAYFAGLPYIEGFKQKMGDVTKAEGFYEWTFYLVFSMLNVYVRTQVKTIKGRADMVVWMPDTIYVFELKINGTAQDALAQINKSGYAIPYQTDGKQVVKVGIRFSTDTLNVEEWVIE